MLETENLVFDGVGPHHLLAHCGLCGEKGPQGGNGVAAGTTNYPSAATHPRLAGEAGFRGCGGSLCLDRFAATLNIYYNSQWQAIETRTNGTASSNMSSQMVWSAAYINAPVLLDTYTGGVIQPNSRLYFTQDANWDTTAVVGYDASTGTWNVVQRYVYSPYGNMTILNPDFTTAPAGTVPMVNNLYQGMAGDPVTGLYYERARWYSPSLGTWISQDPAGYINGADTYQFVGDGPLPYGRGSDFRGGGRSAGGGWVRTTRGHNARGFMGRECWMWA